MAKKKRSQKKKRTTKKVYCKGCVFLLLRDGVPPVCTATASFKDSPIRPDVDVVGAVQATHRNRSNNCRYRRRFFRSGLQRKIRAHMLEGGEELSLDEVPKKVGTKTEEVARRIGTGS